MKFKNLQLGNVIFILGLIFLLVLSVLLYRETIYVYLESRNIGIIDDNYENYIQKYNENAAYDFISMQDSEIINILGNPYVTLQKHTKQLWRMNESELWIYMPNLHKGEESDLTGIYIYLENNKVIDYDIDEFNGLSITLDNFKNILK